MTGHKDWQDIEVSWRELLEEAWHRLGAAPRRVWRGLKAFSKAIWEPILIVLGTTTYVAVAVLLSTWLWPLAIVWVALPFAVIGVALWVDEMQIEIQKRKYQHAILESASSHQSGGSRSSALAYVHEEENTDW